MTRSIPLDTIDKLNALKHELRALWLGLTHPDAEEYTITLGEAAHGIALRLEEICAVVDPPATKLAPTRRTEGLRS